MNVYFISLVIREMQIKIATRYHFTSVRMAKIKDNNKGVEKFGTLNMMLVGIIKWCRHFGKLYGGVSKNYKQKHYITQQFHSEVYNPCKKQNKTKQNTNSNRYMHLHVHNSIIYNCQGMEAT